MIGFMVNNFLPLRAGEVAKAIVLKSRQKVGLSSGLATIVVERIFDGLTVSLISLVLLFVPNIPIWVRQAAMGLLAVFLAVFISLTFMATYKHRVLSWAAFGQRFRGRLGQKLDDLLSGFAQGLVILQQGTSVVKIIILSVILWLSQVAVFYFVLLSLGINLPMVAPFVILIFAFIAVTIPPLPGTSGRFNTSLS